MDLTEIIPDEHEDVLNFVLWNHTAFPFASKEETIQQLHRWKFLKNKGLSQCICCGKGFDLGDKVHLGWSCHGCTFATTGASPLEENEGKEKSDGDYKF